MASRVSCPGKSTHWLQHHTVTTAQMRTQADRISVAVGTLVLKDVKRIVIDSGHI